MKSKNLGTKTILIVLILGVAGQIAWGLENSWFGTFVYDEITTDTTPIAIMNALSAITATLTTFFIGTYSDRTGKRKPFIKWGFIIWGFTTGGFVLVKYAPSVPLQAALAVIFDCVMTFFGSTAYDACFNAWSTDISDETNRGTITSIIQLAPLISGILLTAAGAVIDNFGYSIFFWGVGIIVTVTGWIAGSALQDSKKLKPQKDTENMFLSIIHSFSFSSIKQNKRLFLVLSALCLFSCGFQVSYAYEMIYANTFLGYSKTVATLLTGLGLPVMVFASIFTGKLCDKQKGMKALLVSPVVFAIGTFIYALGKGNLVFILIGRALLYGGWMAMTVGCIAVFKNLTPEESHGRFEGIRMIFNVMLPMVIGPAIGSALINAFNLGPLLYYVTGIIGLLAYIPLFFLWKENKKANNL